MSSEQHSWFMQAVVLTSCLPEHSGAGLWWTRRQQDQAWANLLHLSFVPANMSVLHVQFAICGCSRPFFLADLQACATCSVLAVVAYNCSSVLINNF